ncbi:hypothetical protein KR093_004312 [Drosophila rubida]|uniref:Uncharacterized protein n=1 Tax=Drosophila rubida TaxID=30044 RepID=A0AAD4K9V1_9MUSC|nr:hypothetical protein KR093_004312 [Drosophila rubida]
MPRVKSYNDGKLPQKPYPPQMRRGGGDNEENANDAPISAGIKVEKQKSTNKGDPTSTQSVLKCYLKHHKSSIEAAKHDSTLMAENLQKMKMTVAEKNQENANFKKTIVELEQQMDELKVKNNKLDEDHQNLKRSYDKFNALYTVFETEYDEKFASLNLDVHKLKAELSASQKRNEELEKKLKCEKRMEQMIHRQQTEIDKNEALVSHLEQHNMLLLNNLNTQKVKFERKHADRMQQKMFQLTQLERELHQLTEMYASKINDSAKCEEVMRKKLEKLETKLHDSINMAIEIEKKHAETEAAHVQMRLQFEQEKTQILDNFQSQLQQKQMQIGALEMELQQQSANYARQVDEHDRRVAELQAAVDRLRDSETRYLELQRHNSKVSKEALLTVERLEEEAKVKDKKIEQLMIYTENMSTLFASKEKNYVLEIESLKGTNEQLKANHMQRNTALLEDLRKCESQVEERRELFNRMQAESLASMNELGAEKKKLAKELIASKKLHEEEILQLQNKLKQQEVELDATKRKFFDLESSKDAIITELKYKIGQIRYVFGQPIGSATIVNREEIVSQTNGTIELLAENEDDNLAGQLSSVLVEIDDIYDENVNTFAEASTALSPTAEPLSLPAPLIPVPVAAAPPAAPATAPGGASAAAPAGGAVQTLNKRRKLVKRSTFRLNDSEFNSDSEENEPLASRKPRKYVAKKKSTGQSAKSFNAFDHVKKL